MNTFLVTRMCIITGLVFKKCKNIVVNETSINYNKLKRQFLHKNGNVTENVFKIKTY